MLTLAQICPPALQAAVLGDELPAAPAHLIHQRVPCLHRILVHVSSSIQSPSGQNWACNRDYTVAFKPLTRGKPSALIAWAAL